MIVLILSAPARGANQDQQIELQAGWNLVSFSVLPQNAAPASVVASLIAQGRFSALWSYEAATGVWRAFPVPSGSGVDPIQALEIGRGYWLKVGSAGPWTVSGPEATTPQANSQLVVGWNLVGVAGSTPIPYGQFFARLPVAEIWTFDAAANRFKGVVFSPVQDQAPNPEDFSTLDPGRGYWVRMSGLGDLTPRLATYLPPDRDVTPGINPDLACSSDPTRPRFGTTQRSPGDLDYAGDGCFDGPETQTALAFDATSELQTLTILNRGRGVLGYVASLQLLNRPDVPWLRFRTLDSDGGNILFTQLTGSVSSDSARLDVLADRTGLPPGVYRARATVSSNAPLQPTREIAISMIVPNFAGDYEVDAAITTVNGRPAEMGNSKFFMSLYEDRDGLKAVIDETRSLLFPIRTRLGGGTYQNGTNKLIVSGSLALPASDPANPYGVALRRDVTLLADRKTSADRGLGPLDLKGQYREAIRDVLGQPILIEGTLLAKRVADQPTVRDENVPVAVPGGSIPDGTGSLVRAFEISASDRVLVTEVDVLVDLAHPRPADLVVRLSAPSGSGKSVLLRNRREGPVGPRTYDADTLPEESMQQLTGILSTGLWTLTVEDQVAGAGGSLNSAELFIRGTKVHSISGTVTGVGPGATVLLAGCGIVRTTTTSGSGAYRFDDLIDCLYQLTIEKPGFVRASTLVSLAGGDATAPVLSPGSTTVPPTPPPVVQPSGGGFTLVAWSHLGSAGSEDFSKRQQYGADAGTFDLDRLPLNPRPAAPGGEDAELFLATELPQTQTNRCASYYAPTSTQRPEIEARRCKPPGDGGIDPPVGVNGRRIVLSIGQPINGAAVAGDYRIEIGAFP